MKKYIEHLLFAASALLFACSFAEGPTMPATGTTPEAATLVADEVGGAYLIFAGKYGGDITQKEMAGQRTLSVDGCSSGAAIFKFTLSITKSGKTSSSSAESNQLTADMQSKLKSLSPGDSFEFSQIKANHFKSSGKEVVDVRSKKFTVVGKGA